MKAERPRLIDVKPKGIVCKNCKYAFRIDAKRMKYYCVPPNGGRCGVYYAEHSCGNGEKR